VHLTVHSSPVVFPSQSLTSLHGNPLWQLLMVGSGQLGVGVGSGVGLGVGAGVGASVSQQSRLLQYESQKMASLSALSL
jgi:hypothetical protein